MKKEILKKIKKDYQDFEDYDYYKRLEYLNGWCDVLTFAESNAFWSIKSEYQNMDENVIMELEKFRKQVIDSYESHIGRTLDSSYKFYQYVDEDEFLDMSLNIIFMKYLKEIDLVDTEDIYFRYGDVAEICDDFEDAFDYFGYGISPIFDTEPEIIYAYQNIEQEEIVLIRLDEVNEFEKNHSIVYPSDEDEYFCLRYLFKVDFPKIRADFLRKSFKSNQNNAKKYLIKKYPNIYKH